MAVTKFEEKNQYHIEVYLEKNRFDLSFIGSMKKPEDIPHYIEHIGKAIEMLKPGFLIFAEITETSTPPGFPITKLLKQSQAMMKDGGNAKTAVLVSSKLILQRLTLNVVSKLSGLDIKIFTKRDEAEAWLQQK